MSVEINLASKKVKLNLEFRVDGVVMDPAEAVGLFATVVFSQEPSADPVLDIQKGPDDIWYGVPLRQGECTVTVTATTPDSDEITDTIEVEVVA